ncbi:MAG TPA: NifU family protein [Salinimicrobium sp.]|nr:NifU family protein [Salinimicrobium sp.]
MINFSISIKPTNNPSIVKFEANKFLTQNENFEFKNIEEAKNSTLAQQLFHLPFVKTVYIAQNFVAIEKYNIVEWGDIQEELSEQIENFLNSGEPIINSTENKSTKLVPVTVYAESTPNPAVMKFVTNRKLVISTSEFKNIDQTKNAPLPQKLFHFPFIKEVFIDENYISINKYDLVEWEDITSEIREFIREYIQNGGIVLNEEHFEEEKQTTGTEKISEPKRLYDDTSLQIIDILDEYVKPAVASDGGNILFDSYNEENQTVKVILQGACSGCPSSTFTLKNGIENMLKEMMPQKVAKVEAING